MRRKRARPVVLRIERMSDGRTIDAAPMVDDFTGQAIVPQDTSQALGLGQSATPVMDAWVLDEVRARGRVEAMRMVLVRSGLVAAPPELLPSGKAGVRLRVTYPRHGWRRV